MCRKNRVQLICTECGHEFHLLAEFNKHMLNVHGNSVSSTTSWACEEDAKPKYKCSICGREFVALSSKSRHEREHAGLKPFPCHICSYEFSRMSNLRTHLLRVHPKDIDVLYQFKSIDPEIGSVNIEFNFGKK